MRDSIRDFTGDSIRDSIGDGIPFFVAVLFGLQPLDHGSMTCPAMAVILDLDLRLLIRIY
jgi:hypothetical protein